MRIVDPDMNVRIDDAILRTASPVELLRLLQMKIPGGS